jgi:hypothetical protein
MGISSVRYLSCLGGRSGDKEPAIFLGPATNEDHVTLRRGYGKKLASNGDDGVTSRQSLVCLINDLSARVRLLQHNLVGDSRHIPGLQQCVSR